MVVLGVKFSCKVYYAILLLDLYIVSIFGFYSTDMLYPGFDTVIYYWTGSLTLRLITVMDIYVYSARLCYSGHFVFILRSCFMV